jgi:hypothetical protein
LCVSTTDVKSVAAFTNHATGTVNSPGYDGKNLT